VARTATLALLAVLGCVGTFGITRAGPVEVDGRDQRLQPTNRPTIEAAFLEESYAPGETARLVIWTSGSRVSLQVFRAGTEPGRIRAQDVMLGSAVTPVRLLASLEHGRAIRVRIGDWPSGLYFAELWGSRGKVGYAPFVLRPRRLGEEATSQSSSPR
jgi:hypothetical protein